MDHDAMFPSPLFPLFFPNLPLSEQRKDLFSGLGVTVFDGPQGHHCTARPSPPIMT